MIEVGSVLEGKVTGITKFGAFVELPEGKTGMVHISEVAPTFVKEIRDFLTENQQVKVKVINISEDGKISLSIKKAVEPQRNNAPAKKNVSQGRPGGFEWQNTRNNSGSFEEMLQRFKQTSDEKMSDINKRNVESKRGGYSSRRGSGQR